MPTEYRICTRCIMDTSDPDIRFEKNGYCNHCTTALEKLQNTPFHKDKSSFEKLVQEVKKEGRTKKYDCIIGLSGGTDSSYVAYRVKTAGLRPLAVHLDNGWDSELAVKNIENICNTLNIDLFTYVIDWEEFKDLQLSFLKASTPDSEIPSDHAITSILYKTAIKEDVKYVLTGVNTASEAILPNAWSRGHADWKYISGIQKQFGSKELKTFPHYSIFELMRFRLIKGIKWINFLDYVDYSRQKAKEIVQKEIGWRDYGLKHYESVYTKFFQGYILPRKFGFDKRRAHFSSLICAGQITREKALEEMKKEIYPPQDAQQDVEYVINKFGLTKEEFEAIMKAPPKTYWDYPNYQKTLYYRIAKKLYRFVRRR